MNHSSPSPSSTSLWPGQSISLLKTLHILTRDGKLNQDSRRKLKQIQHLFQLLRPHLEGKLTFADLGAGKSYLGFMLYDLWLREHPETHLWAIEQRPELINTCTEIAHQSGFDRIAFIAEDIERAGDREELPETIEVVTALHACDTATDDAIHFALKKNATTIALIPCCQASVARELKSLRLKPPLSTLFGHDLHRREFGSHLTNVFRALYLESHGYKVRVTELTGWEHSMKNELILATRIQRSNGQATRELNQLRELFPIEMRLFSIDPI